MPLAAPDSARSARLMAGLTLLGVRVRRRDTRSVSDFVRLWFGPERQLSLPLCELRFSLCGREQFHIAGKLSQNL
jgi:hypothetical protein